MEMFDLEKLTRDEIKKELGSQYFALPSGKQMDWQKVLPRIIDEVSEKDEFAHRVWVLDFARAKRCVGTTATDIGRLCGLYSGLQEKGVELVALNASSSIKDLFELEGLHELIPVRYSKDYKK